MQGDSGISEKDVVLSIAIKVHTKLSTTPGITTVLTREQDVSLSNQQRAGIFKAKQADLLITLHAGGTFSRETQGIALYYPDAPALSRTDISTGVHPQNHSTRSRIIAQTLSTHLIQETSANTLGIHAIPNPLFLAINAPACLIEVGCLTNAGEELALSDEIYLDKLADGIVQGILALLESNTSTQITPTLSNESISPDPSTTEEPQIELAPL